MKQLLTLFCFFSAYLISSQNYFGVSLRYASEYKMRYRGESIGLSYLRETSDDFIRFNIGSNLYYDHRVAPELVNSQKRVANYLSNELFGNLLIGGKLSAGVGLGIFQNYSLDREPRGYYISEPNGDLYKFVFGIIGNVNINYKITDQIWLDAGLTLTNGFSPTYYWYYTRPGSTNLTKDETEKRHYMNVKILRRF